MIFGLHKQETHKCGRDMFKDTTNYPWKIYARERNSTSHTLIEYTNT